jgi:NADH-quinone oxidoreductase subunit C
MTATKLAQKLGDRFGEDISKSAKFRGEVTVTLAKASRIVEVCQFAKDELGFDYLVDLSMVDHYGEDPRFEVVYELCGLEHGCHLRLKTRVSEETGELPSVTGVWRTADWHEREAYDMMGVKFTGHPNLRRILMWEGYPHFPLRKDFPLEGKETDVPDVAFSKSAPLEGGPFVTTPGGESTGNREPRRRNPKDWQD